MPAFNIPYSDYLKYIVPSQTYTDESGNVIPNMAPAVDEATWNALDNAQKYQMLYGYGNPNGQRGTPNFDPSGREEDAQAFQAQFGAAPWQDDQSGRSAGEFGKRYLWGYGDPQAPYDGADPSQWMIDPSRVHRDADGRWVIESDNIKGDYLKQKQHESSQRSQRNQIIAAAILATAGTAGAMAGGAGVGAEAGAGTGAFDMGGSAGVFDSFGNPLYASPEMGGGFAGPAGGAMDMGVGLDEVAQGFGAQGLGQPALGAPGFEGGGLLDGSFGSPGQLQGSPWYKFLLDNPMGTARTILGAASLFGGNSGGQGGGDGGGDGGDGSSFGPAPAFHPWMGPYDYQPDFFDVPFMPRNR